MYVPGGDFSFLAGNTLMTPAGSLIYFFRSAILGRFADGGPHYTYELVPEVD